MWIIFKYSRRKPACIILDPISDRVYSRTWPLNRFQSKVSSRGAADKCLFLIVPSPLRFERIGFWMEGGPPSLFKGSQPPRIHGLMKLTRTSGALPPGQVDPCLAHETPLECQGRKVTPQPLGGNQSRSRNKWTRFYEAIG